jgi:integrase/recombinase XerD
LQAVEGGGRHRNAMLANDLLLLLREWWKVGKCQGVMHPDGWLFPGQHYSKPVSTRQLHRIVVEAALAAGITKRVGPHALRHSPSTALQAFRRAFATHLLEDGVDVSVIQALLGHAKLDTTALYTRVATRMVRAIVSPLDRLALFPGTQAAPTG